MAIIGTGNQGTNDLRGFLTDERVQIVAVCDVNRESPGYWDGAVAGREPAKRHRRGSLRPTETGRQYKGCDAYVDFREVSGRKDIDAVEIATPDHWHAIPVIAACKAGKDIYCQKPLALTIAEGRAMSNAVQQVPSQSSRPAASSGSDQHFRRACELVRNGRIGKLQTVACGLPGGRPDFGRDRQPQEAREGARRVRIQHAGSARRPTRRTPRRAATSTSAGFTTTRAARSPTGAGTIRDCAQWGMGTEHTGPVEIRNAKGEFPPDALWNTATDFYFEAIYRRTA